MNISVIINYIFGERTMLNQNDTLNNNFDNIKDIVFRSCTKNGMAKTVARVSAAAMFLGSLIIMPPVNRVTAAEGTECSAESVSHSTSASVKTTLIVKNQGSATIKAYWLNYSGNRKLYKEIQTGKSFSVTTYVTHPWVITDASDNCFMVYYPTEEARTLQIQ